MKISLKLFCCIILISLIFPTAGPALTGETIKVLMLEKPDSQTPSEPYETVDFLTGEVFINGQFYSGNLEIIKDDKGLYVVKTILLEDYLKAAVASEMCLDWGIEDIKAQTVISRTYAYYQKTVNAGKNFHISSDVLQPRYEDSNKALLIIYALKETRGIVMDFQTPPVKELYPGACKGKTEDLSELKGKYYINLLSYYFPGIAIQNTKELYSQTGSSDN